MTQLKRLIVGVLTPIHNTAPKMAQDAESTLVVRQVFQSPFSVRPGATDAEPALFTGPLVAEDFGGVRGYRAQVRTDVKFSDGSPMTAEDVASSLRDTTLIKEQTVVEQDGDWVVFRLKRDNARFHCSLSHPKCSVIRQVGDRVIGTGPFLIDPASEPANLRLIPNPHWPSKLALGEIVFKAYPLDDQGHAKALLEAIDSGEVDLCTGLARDDIKNLSGVRKSILPAVSTALLYLNVESPRLVDVRVRKALAHSIDRLALARTCYENPLAFAASSILPRSLGFADDGMIHDPQRARTLLAEPGVKLPEKLELLTTWGPRPYLPRPVKVAEGIAEQLHELGVEVVVVRPRDINDFFDRVIASRHDLVVAGWLADTLDPCDFLDAILASDRVPSYGNIAFSANHARLASAEVDQALHAYRSEPNPQRLAALVGAVSDQAAVVPILYGAAVTVSSYRVLNLQSSATEEIPFETLDLA